MSGPRLDDITRAFGAWVKEQREARGISQANLAEAIGRFRQSQMTSLENGSRPATISEALRICAVFGIDLPALAAQLPDFCAKCGGSPPPGFTCNQCGAS